MEEEERRSGGEQRRPERGEGDRACATLVPALFPFACQLDLLARRGAGLETSVTDGALPP